MNSHRVIASSPGVRTAGAAWHELETRTASHASRHRPPIVEITGPRGSGKSTVSVALGHALQRCGLRVERGDRLGWGRMPGAEWLSEPLGNVVQECLLAPTVLSSRELAPLRAGLEAIRCSDESQWTKCRAARGLWRQIGLRLRADASIGPGRMILFDEGLWHTTHYIFVQAWTSPDCAALEAFCRLLPLPDLLITIRAPREALVERLMARPHPPRRGMTRSAVETYVDRALEVFDHVEALSFVRQRLLLVSGIERPDAIAAQIVERLYGKSAFESGSAEPRPSGASILQKPTNVHG